MAYMSVSYRVLRPPARGPTEALGDQPLTLMGLVPHYVFMKDNKYVCLFFLIPCP